MTTTSAALEREAETVRADLSATLEDLRSNMTRAALAGGAAALAKEGGATVARAAARRARDHPAGHFAHWRGACHALDER